MSATPRECGRLGCLEHYSGVSSGMPLRVVRFVLLHDSPRLNEREWLAETIVYWTWAAIMPISLHCDYATSGTWEKPLARL
eukprot:6310873-Amphidinium_carterae.2